jgi:hypothetical protein
MSFSYSEYRRRAAALDRAIARGEAAAAKPSIWGRPILLLFSPSGGRGWRGEAEARLERLRRERRALEAGYVQVLMAQPKPSVETGLRALGWPSAGRAGQRPRTLTLKRPEPDWGGQGAANRLTNARR